MSPTLAALLLTVALEPFQEASAPHDHSAHRQGEVAARGAQVMPFDLERTLHRFVTTAQGGVQSVVSKESDPTQVALVREHLRSEAARFSRGDFSSPAAIHGADMSGLSTLAAAPGQVRVDYADLPAGGELRFTTSDPSLVQALHALVRRSTA